MHHGDVETKRDARKLISDKNYSLTDHAIHE